MTQRDAALLKRWSEHRDAEAFSDLVSHYADMVYATCKRIMGNPSDAEELTQECFLKLATGRVRIRASVGGWLHSVATSLCINRIRTDARRRRREEIAAEAAPSVAEPTWDDIQRHVDEAIADLPERLREPIIRHFLQRETHEEIARAIGVSRSAVTKQIAQGIDRVRDRLRKAGIVTTAAALTALASGSMAEAAPASLKATLGRLALSGVTQTAAAGSAVLTKVMWVAVVVLVAGAGAVVAYNRIGDAGSPPMRERHATQPPRVTAVPAEAKEAGEVAVPAPHMVDAFAPEIVPGKTASISGRVYDQQTQQGIAGAELRLTGDMGRTVMKTDEHGEYRFDDVAPGKWYVSCAKANGYYIGTETRKRGQIPPNVRELTVETGRGPAGIDFALGRGEGIRGVAFDASGKPVAGALVTGFVQINGHHITNTAESGPDGAFAATGFPATVNLFVWAEKGEFVSEAVGPFALPQEGRPLDPVVLQPEAVLRGVVRDKQGKPSEGLKVVAQSQPYGARRVREAVSGPEGRFEIRGMHPGNTTLDACRDIEVVSDPYPSITLAPGEVVNDIVLTCTLGRQSISGQVVDSRGQGVHGAEVNCLGRESSRRASARTGGDGRFVLDALDPGMYTLAASHEGHLGSDGVEVAAGSANVRLVMSDSVSVEGRVLDDTTGRPVTGYDIKYCLFPEEMFLEQRYEKNENRDGTFKLDVAQVGDVPIAVRAEGYLLGMAVVAVDGTQASIRNVDIRLKPQADLHGTVRDGEGAPVVGAVIFSGEHRSSHDADNCAAARTGDDGGFVLPACKLGHDFITVFHPNYPQSEVPLEPEHYTGQPIDVRVQSGTQLACTVLSNGVPNQGAMVSVSKPDRPGDPKSARTGPDGECVIEGLPPGDYHVRIDLIPPEQKVSEAAQERSVVLLAGQTTNLAVEFEEGSATVSGEVSDPPRGMSIRLAVKSAYGEQVYHRYFEGERADPAYSFPNLPAGEAVMTVSWEPQGDTTGGNMSRRYTFTLTPDAALRQDIRLDEGAALWGTVGPLSPEELTVVRVLFGRFTAEDVAARAYAIPADFCAGIHVASDGTFRMGGFQPGVYTLIGLAFPRVRTEPMRERQTSTVIEVGEQGQELILRLP